MMRSDDDNRFDATFVSSESMRAKMSRLGLTNVVKVGFGIDPELAGNERGVADGLLGDFLPKLGPRVQRSVLVVLPGDAGEYVLDLGLVVAVLVDRWEAR